MIRPGGRDLCCARAARLSHLRASPQFHHPTYVQVVPEGADSSGDGHHRVNRRAIQGAERGPPQNRAFVEAPRSTAPPCAGAQPSGYNLTSKKAHPAARKNSHATETWKRKLSFMVPLRACRVRIG